MNGALIEIRNRGEVVWTFRLEINRRLNAAINLYTQVRAHTQASSP
jgi:hypothetical protein